MANKTFGGLTATTSLADADLFAVEKGGNSRKITAANVRSALAPTRLVRVVANTSASSTSWNINSTSYFRFGTAFSFTLDFDYFPFTQYRISVAGGSTEAAQTVKMQLHDMGIGAVISAGDDLTINNAGALYNSAWITRTATLTGGGIRELSLYAKGSNSTVDLSGFQFCDVELRL